MPAYFWHGERRMPQMLDVSVWGTDKALHKFESGMPTSRGLGGEILAAGQVLDSGGGGGRRGGGDKERQGMKDERALFTMLMNHFLLMNPQAALTNLRHLTLPTALLYVRG